MASPRPAFPIDERAGWSSTRRFRARSVTVVVAALAAAASLAGSQARALATTPAHSFRYGYDLSDQAPAPAGSGASAAARQVMASLPGTLDDIALMGWGDGNPEPRPGLYDLANVSARVNMVLATGGVPVITLCG